jgi:TatD DNase family protein
MGLYLGFTGVVTFPPKKTDPKSQEDLLEVLEKCPLDRMLVETDAPYLAPQKYRGQRSEPWMTEEVIKKIAEVKGLRVEEVEEEIFENSKRLFKIV